MYIKVKYFSKKIDKINKISVGDWYDLRSAETVMLKKGESYAVPLGVGMILPDGFEAHVLPRSSTFKNFRVFCLNSMGIIDNSYNGNNDQWHFLVHALEDTIIPENSRIAQFRIVKNQPLLNFIEVKELKEKNRGNFGSTGIK